VFDIEAADEQRLAILQPRAGVRNARRAVVGTAVPVD
jgi:hypothetical protein